MNAISGDLAFLPLGGTGEIGMNLNLYRTGGQYLAIDCGIGFGGAAHPEVEVMMPDPAFIAERRDRLVGLVITHAHEDHIGAVAHLWRSMRCPVYATPFATSVLKRKLGEVGLQNEVRIHTIKPGGAFEVGPFKLQFLNMAHSVPESQALVIRTQAGIVLHTGDWKFDDEPLVGPRCDEAALRALGDEGVLAMVCDSTNAMVDGASGSEGDVRRSLADLIAGLKGRVAVTCFASNVARFESIALAARDCGRSVALVGRSLRNIDASARECGYLKGIPPFASEDAAQDIPDDNLLLIVTGSQGEARSALARIAADQHPRIELGEGDTVVFSSRMIPGNERAIGLVQDNLVRRGVTLITDKDHLTHVSGHPARDELKRLYGLVRPKYAVPVHGEWRHLSAHAALAQELQVTPILMEDGDILSLYPGVPEVVDSAQVGKLVLDGTRLVPLQGGVMGARRRMLFNGVVIASIAVDAQGQLRGVPRISAPGLFEADDPEIARVSGELSTSIGDFGNALRRDEAALLDAVKAALRRALGKRLAKRPMVDVHMLRV
jgi:ribonuclease J